MLPEEVAVLDAETLHGFIATQTKRIPLGNADDDGLFAANDVAAPASVGG